jgi:transcriptional regulator with XRE-family HTH domain
MMCAMPDHGGDLGGFLRARRDALRPADVGLPPGGRRRTPGLRREEVALLAGVSVSWYTWLEQGRPVNASAEVLDALARVLRLDPVEHAHLHALAGRARPPAPAPPADVPAAVRDMLAALEPHPAYVLGPAWDYLAWNPAHARLFPQLDALPAAERNLVWVVFTHPDARTLIADWEDEARRVLSQFRADTAPHRGAPAVTALVARLREASPEFRRWWPRHDVAGFATRRRRFRHPAAGELEFVHLQLTPDGAPGLRVVVHTPVAGDDSAARLAGV